jgi:hypothetical protein
MSNKDQPMAAITPVPAPLVDSAGRRRPRVRRLVVFTGTLP